MALEGAGLAPRAAIKVLRDAWTMQQDLSQLLRVALGNETDPSDEPAALRNLLAAAGGASDFAALRTRLRELRVEAHRTYESLLAASGGATE